MDCVPTSTLTIVETEHGRLRRRQRGLDKKDLRAAIKHGIRSPGNYPHNGKPTARYEYNDIVYIVNMKTKEEVTCYAKPIKLKPVPISDTMQKEHDRAQNNIRNDLDSWTSNTVMVVDTSGSMRASDVWGARTRLQAVWMSIALDFIAHRLERGEGTSTDVISIIMLGESSIVHVRESPCTWVLYNKIVHLHNGRSCEPYGHGPFLRSLNKAHKLLVRTSNSACAVGLIFLSDGKPSDSSLGKNGSFEQCSLAITKNVESLAKRFGRRLTFTAVGVGDSDDFSTLEAMVDGAKNFGAIADFKLPSMTSSALGSVFTSVATSITSTQSEMTDVETLKQFKVRSIYRESRKKADIRITTVSSDDFYIYPASSVTRRVYKEWRDVEGKLNSYFEQTALQHPDAKFVAFAKGAFGEGAERYAFRFFEVAADQTTVVGDPMVAKESRKILDEDRVGDDRARQQFAHRFCKTQQLAMRLAREFEDMRKGTYRIHSDTPHISVLDCCIYEMVDCNLGTLTVLVEKKLEGVWKKWNSNNGYVEGMTKTLSRQEFERNIILQDSLHFESHTLGFIGEGSEDEEDEADCDEEKMNMASKIQPVLFNDLEVAQAFSHFTYQATGRKRLVCDLQGVYDEEANVLCFSDPVIHYHNTCREDRRNVHGQTDRGLKGMHNFFQTHYPYHGHLCRLMLRGFRCTNNRQNHNTHKS